MNIPSLSLPEAFNAHLTRTLHDDRGPERFLCVTMRPGVGVRSQVATLLGDDPFLRTLWIVPTPAVRHEARARLPGVEAVEALRFISTWRPARLPSVTIVDALFPQHLPGVLDALDAIPGPVVLFCDPPEQPPPRNWRREEAFAGLGPTIIHRTPPH